MTRLIFVLSLFVMVDSAHAISCREFLLRVGHVTLEFAGQPLMQEGVPLEWQLLAVDHSLDQDLAWAWQKREERNLKRPLRELGLVVEESDPLPASVDFIQSIRLWKTLTNEEIRAQMILNDLLLNWSLLKQERQGPYVAGELSRVALSDLMRWQESFPDRPIPRELLSFKKEWK